MIFPNRGINNDNRYKAARSIERPNAYYSILFEQRFRGCCSRQERHNALLSGRSLAWDLAVYSCAFTTIFVASIAAPFVCTVGFSFLRIATW